VPENPARLPDFTRWPSFPFEGDLRIKELAEPVAVEPPRSGEDAADCVACNTPDEAYIWVSERWRVRAMDRPTGLPMVLILECRSHLDLGDLPNLLAAELGVMTVRLERAVRSLDGVARVHVNRWGDGSAHLHMWFLARPYGRLQLRGTFLSLWDDILPVIPETQWRENLALVAAWLAEFGGRPLAEPPHIKWQSPSTISERHSADAAAELALADAAASRAADSAVGERAAADADPTSADATTAQRTADTGHGGIDSGEDGVDTSDGVTDMTGRKANGEGAGEPSPAVARVANAPTKDLSPAATRNSPKAAPDSAVEAGVGDDPPAGADADGSPSPEEKPVGQPAENGTSRPRVVDRGSAATVPNPPGR
jgi:hypothetical protein